MVFAYHIYGFKQLGKSLPGLCGNEHDFRILHKGKGISDLFRKTVNGLVVLFHGIPLVDGNDDRFTSFVGNAGNLGILFGHAFHRINDQDNYIRTLYGAHRTHNHVMLQVLFDFILAAQTRRIDKHIFPAVKGHIRIHGITGGAGNIGNNQTVFAEHPVDNGGFTHIGLSDNRHTDTVVFFRAVRFVREMGNYLVQHFAQS